MAIVHIEPGPQASQVVIHSGIAYVVGVICPLADMDAYEQARFILQRIDDLLAQAGTNKSRLLRGWLIATTHENRSLADQAWMEWLDGHNTPARVSMVAGLGMPHFKVEISVDAAV
jgi:enamine deaminase RidA (YjgF/YER057c/UK114 family)